MASQKIIRELKLLANPKNVAGSGRFAGAQKRGDAEEVKEVIF